jgi:hypothetical protein
VVKRGRLVVLLVFGALGGVAACSSGDTSSAPLGHGDHLIVDVEASTLPPQPQNPTPDPIFAPVDGSSKYGGVYDAYTAFNVCSPPKAGASMEAGAADDDATAPDDGAASYPAEGGSTTGCVPFPASCASQANCVCLLKAFASQIPCIPNCAVTKHGFSINCP